MHDVVLRRGAQPGTEVVEIVAVGAGGDRSDVAAADARVQIRLAVVAAIDGVRAIAGIGLLAGVEHDQRPSVPRRVLVHAPARRRGHRGTGRVIHRRPRSRIARRDVRERHRVHAAADRDREALVAVEHRDEARADVSARRARAHLSPPSSARRTAAARACGALSRPRLGCRHRRAPPCAVRSPPGRCATLTRWRRRRAPSRPPRGASTLPALLAHAQAERGGLGEARLRDRRGGVRRASTRKSASGRPFLPKRVPIDTSMTPACARRRSPAIAISSPVMSSTSNSRIATTSASASAAPHRRARSNTSARTMLGMPGSERVPAPHPTLDQAARRRGARRSPRRTRDGAGSQRRWA